MPHPLRTLLLAVPAVLVLAAVAVWGWHTFGPGSRPAGKPEPPVLVDTRVVGGVTFEVEHAEGEDYAAAGDDKSVLFQRRDDFLEFADGIPVLNRVGYPSPHPGDVVRWLLDGRLLINGQPQHPHPFQPRPLNAPGIELKFDSRITGHNLHDTLTVDWSGNGGELVTASADATARVWDMSDTPRVKAEIAHDPPRTEGVRGNWGLLAAVSPDGRTVVTGYRGGAVAVPWDVATAKADWPLTGPAGDLRGLQFLTNDWLLEARGERLFGRDLTGDRSRTVDLGAVAAPFMPVFAVSRDGTTLATADAGTVTVSRLAVGKDTLTVTRMASWPFAGAECVALSADGQLLAAVREQNQLMLFEVAKGPPGRRLRVREAVEPDGQRTPAAIQALAFAPDGATLAVGTDDAVRLYDVASGRERGWVAVPWVRALAYSPDGKTLAAGLRNHPLAGARIWATAELK